MAGIIDSLDERWLREGAQDEAEFETFIQRRMAGEPVHRILGWREFWGMKFYLSLETLEPRPDSEIMIEVLLKNISDKNSSLRILDLGTGTGCLLLAALWELSNANGIGIDKSADAIATAKKNADANQLQHQAQFQALDWNDADALLTLGSFDVIMCNPPYIPTDDISELQIEVREHDPIAALDGGKDGLEPYRHLIPLLPYLLSQSGIALFEFGHNQASDIQQILQSTGFYASAPIKDLGGNDRIIVARHA